MVRWMAANSFFQHFSIQCAPHENVTNAERINPFPTKHHNKFQFYFWLARGGTTKQKNELAQYRALHSCKIGSILQDFQCRGMGIDQRLIVLEEDNSVHRAHQSFQHGTSAGVDDLGQLLTGGYLGIVARLTAVEPCLGGADIDQIGILKHPTAWNRLGGAFQDAVARGVQQGHVALAIDLEDMGNAD